MIVILIFIAILIIILTCSWYECRRIKQMLCPKCSNHNYYLELYRPPGIVQCPRCGRFYSEYEWTFLGQMEAKNERSSSKSI